jgi:ribosomal protein L31E
MKLDACLRPHATDNDNSFHTYLSLHLKNRRVAISSIFSKDFYANTQNKPPREVSICQ